MHSIDDMPDDFPDEVPVADAVEQQMPAVDSPAEEDEREAPLEASPSDWQEQREQVDIQDLEEFDRG
jgi:hypothetical protein